MEEKTTTYTDSQTDIKADSHAQQHSVPHGDETAEGQADVSAAKFERIRRAHQSEVMEDYVEMIADLIAENGEARAVDLASRFGVKSPTVNATIQRLQRDGLVESKPYRSIFLTSKGVALATKCKERHELVRDFLICLGLDPQIADSDAEGVEHHVSDQTLQLFADYLKKHS